MKTEVEEYLSLIKWRETKLNEKTKMKLVVISAILMVVGRTASAQGVTESDVGQGRSFRFPDAAGIALGSLGERRRLPDSGQRLRLRGGREINAGYVQVRIHH